MSNRSLLPRDVNGSLNGTYKIENAWSTRYQWLPCDISFDEQTGKAHITSYINSVHPIHHRDVYSAFNELITLVVPMLNNTLVPVKASRLLYPRIDPAKRKGRKEYPDPEPGPYRSWQSRLRTFRVNKDGKLPTSARVDLAKEFWDIGIQAVIQVTSFDLHPEKPEYPGEDWHLQGMLWLNSVTRTTKATEDVYGVEDLKPAVQEQGSVMIREGRVISFPNASHPDFGLTTKANRNQVFQTKLDRFKLRDPTKSGHLKILVVHLIDPNRRIMSTSMVPCQRRDWWARDIRQRVPVLRRLPMEVFDNILDMVGVFPISATEAERIRVEMLRERAELIFSANGNSSTRQHTEAMLSYKFSLMSDARREQYGRDDDDESGNEEED
ncbi:MAG: hypothetical protein Q9172_001236 [Xanthocarpia lactea]